MAYDERRIAPDVEVWRATPGDAATRILPDGCLDVLVVDGRLLVAGPDTAARVHGGEEHEVIGVRLHAGRGPDLVGVPAEELRDQTLPLSALWGDRRARLLAARVDSPQQLGEWALATSEPDPLGRRLHALLDGGASIGRAADELGYGTRQLHRLALPLFGYGLQHLGRVLRLNRAVAGRRRRGGLGGRGRTHRLRRPGPPLPRLPRAGRSDAERPARRTCPIRSSRRGAQPA